MAITEITDLTVFNLSREFVTKVYSTTKEFPKSERFGLISQLQRAAVSIVANIAEGFGKFHLKEKNRFYRISTGSIQEVKALLMVSCDLKYINKEILKSLIAELTIILKMLNKMIYKKS